MLQVCYRIDRGCDDLAALATWAEAIPGDSGPSRVVEHENNQNVENETREGSRAPQIANDSQISDYAPKEVRTKGRKRGAQMKVQHKASVFVATVEARDTILLDAN